MTSKELRVHPTGWQSSPDVEHFPISLLGYVMPKVYVFMAEVFKLSEDADTNQITENMKDGLEYALLQYPVLTGVLRSNDGNGDMWIEKSKGSTVGFHIKEMTSEDEFPSYADLEQRDFPANMIVGQKVLPKSVTQKSLFSPLGHDGEEDIAVAVFQVNFIRGGMVLGVAVHHSLCDGPGCDGFLATWAENSNAAASKSPFIPVREKFELAGSALDVSKPAESELAGLRTKYPHLQNVGSPMSVPPSDFKMPPMTSQMFHFPKSKAEKLKMQASTNINGSWISTYDAIMALLWASITRAKLDMLHPDLQAEAFLCHAIDTRTRWNPALPDRLLGNGAFAGICPFPTLKDLLTPEKLPEIAASIRSSIKALTPEYLTGALQWVAGYDDKRYLGFKLNSFLGIDLAASSWANMKAYEQHDFGFGCPKALRWPSPVLEGVVFVYPSRAAQKSSEADEGVEVCVCLEESCMRRLLKDEELLAFASPRG